jgi:hypothetical protein
MKNFLRVVCLALLLFYPGLAATGQAKADPKLVQTLMIKSGTTKQFAQFPQMVREVMAQANQQYQSLSQEDFEMLSSMMTAAFEPTLMLDSIQDFLQSNMSDKSIRAVLTWLDSPLGVRMSKLEEDATTVSGYQEMQAMADQLLQNADRVSLMKRLDGAVLATEAAIASALDTQSAMVLAFTATMPIEQRPSVQDIATMMDKNKAQISPYIEQQTILSLLYTYRTLPDADIESYIEFSQSEPARQYNDLVMRGFHDAWMMRAQAMWEQLAKE